MKPGRFLVILSVWTLALACGALFYLVHYVGFRPMSTEERAETLAAHPGIVIIENSRPFWYSLTGAVFIWAAGIIVPLVWVGLRSILPDGKRDPEAEEESDQQSD